MITDRKNTREYIKKGVDTLANTVKVTLGPNGKNVILFNMGKAFITKDGVSVAKHINLSTDSLFAEAGMQILREATAKTAKIAGDGTTTSTILAQSIYHEGLNLINDGYNPHTLKAELTDAMIEANAIVKSMSKEVPFTKEYLSYVAKTSANNDDFLGDIISDAFIAAGKEGLVTFEDSPNDSTYIQTSEGTRLKVGLISQDFVTNQRKMQTVFENSKVLLFNNILSDFKYVIPLLKNIGSEPIVIFADSFGDDFIRKCVSNNCLGYTSILLIKCTGSTGNRKEFFEDLQSVVGGDIIKHPNELNMNKLGFCNRIISNAVETTVINSSADVAARVSIIDSQIEEAKFNNPDVVVALLRRKACLLGKISTIYVGGVTEADRKERYDRVEDAVCAVKSAIDDGICEGGGTAYYRARKTLKEYYSDRPITEGMRIILKALESPIKQLCVNSNLHPDDILPAITDTVGYDFLNNSYVVLEESGIMDSVKVLTTALENAVAAASTLLTTEYIVINE